MELLLSQIEKGLDAKLYYLSLFVALCIPDICCALESSNGNTDRTKYKAWINQYLVKAKPDKYGDILSADHIWQFRCALLHQGRTKHNQSEYKRILFFEPGFETGIYGLHCCIVGAKTEDKSLMIDLQQFCRDIISGAKAWLANNRESKNYIANYEKLIKRYSDGISPVFGCPVIG
jgi:hypothetical protein